MALVRGCRSGVALGGASADSCGTDSLDQSAAECERRLPWIVPIWGLVPTRFDAAGSIAKADTLWPVLPGLTRVLAQRFAWKPVRSCSVAAAFAFASGFVEQAMGCLLVLAQRFAWSPVRRGSMAAAAFASGFVERVVGCSLLAACTPAVLAFPCNCWRAVQHCVPPWTCTAAVLVAALPETGWWMGLDSALPKVAATAMYKLAVAVVVVVVVGTGNGREPLVVKVRIDLAAA